MTSTESSAGLADDSTSSAKTLNDFTAKVNDKGGDDNEIVESMPEDDPNGNVNVHMGEEKPRWGPQHAGAKELAGMYNRTKRFQEVISIVLAVGFFAVDVVAVLCHIEMASLLSIVVAATLGILSVDFISGLVHWGADTWGTVELPFLGKNYIRPFREHHIDPTAITRHDFIEVNGDNFMLCIWKLAHISYQYYAYDLETLKNYYAWHWFWLFMAFYVSITNQVSIFYHLFSEQDF
uniref:Lipid desaturase domain-containing protein n=1 Tax=Romanomermis culicivorax TaxID=13658 RepID=A0A915JWX0_ROMCU